MSFKFPRAEDFDMQEFSTRVCEVGEAYAEATATAEMLEEGRKVTLAKLTQEHQATGFTTAGKPLSYAAAEHLAYADPRYRDYLQKLKAAREAALKLRARFDTSKMYVELIRSHLATQRAEIMMR